MSNIRPEAPSRPTACFGEAVCGRNISRLLLNNTVTVLGEHAPQHSAVTDRHTHQSVFVPAHNSKLIKTWTKKHFSSLMWKDSERLQSHVVSSQSFLLCFHQRWESHLIGRYSLHVKSKHENNIITIKITACRQRSALTSGSWLMLCSVVCTQTQSNTSWGPDQENNCWSSVRLFSLCIRFMLSCQSANMICFFQSAEFLSY